MRRVRGGDAVVGRAESERVTRRCGGHKFATPEWAIGVDHDTVRDGIHRNNVDTGWVTDDRPHPGRNAQRDLGFRPPLDVIDGAAGSTTRSSAGCRTTR